jgi:hypothetical protein
MSEFGVGIGSVETRRVNEGGREGGRGRGYRMELAVGDCNGSVSLFCFEAGGGSGDGASLGGGGITSFPVDPEM